MSDPSVAPTESVADGGQQQDLRERAMNLYIRFIPKALETANFSSDQIMPCFRYFQSELKELTMETGDYASWKSRQSLNDSQSQQLAEIERKIHELEEGFPSRSKEHQRLRETMCGLLYAAMNALDLMHAGLYTRNYEGKKYKEGYEKIASECSDKTELLASAWEEALGSLTGGYKTSVEEMQTILRTELKPDEITYSPRGSPGDNGKCKCTLR